MHWLAPRRHSVHVRECRRGVYDVWQTAAGTLELRWSNERFVSARASWAARVSGAGVDGEAVGGAGLMGEVNAVPVGQRHWPWSDRRQATGAEVNSP